MPTKWSENIAVWELSDEPMLSEDLANLIAGAEIPHARTSHVVLNLSDVSYVNSSNLGQLLKLRRLLGQSKKTLVLCGTSEDVYTVMKITGLDRMFRFASDPLTALAALQIEEEAAGN